MKKHFAVFVCLVVVTYLTAKGLRMPVERREDYSYGFNTIGQRMYAMRDSSLNSRALRQMRRHGMSRDILKKNTIPFNTAEVSFDSPVKEGAMFLQHRQRNTPYLQE